MADFKIKSDIKLDPSEALAQLADLRKQFEETRARLTQPIPIQFAPVGMNDALSKVEKRMERLRAATPPSLSPARTGGATSPARAMEDTAAAAERTAAANSKAARNTGRLAEEAKKTQGAFSQLFVSVSKYILKNAPRWGTSLMKGIASGISSSASLLKSTVTGVLSGFRSIVGAGVSAVRLAYSWHHAMSSTDGFGMAQCATTGTSSTQYLHERRGIVAWRFGAFTSLSLESGDTPFPRAPYTGRCRLATVHHH